MRDLVAVWDKVMNLIALTLPKSQLTSGATSSMRGTSADSVGNASVYVDELNQWAGSRHPHDRHEAADYEFVVAGSVQRRDPCCAKDLLVTRSRSAAESPESRGERAPSGRTASAGDRTSVVATMPPGHSPAAGRAVLQLSERPT